MATTLHTLNCPSCGGRIHPAPNAKRVYCPYCGSAIAIDDGSITVHIHNYDEAELRRIELEEEHRRQAKFEQEQRERTAAEGTWQLERQYSRHKIAWRISLITSIVVIVLFSAIYDGVPQPLHDGIAIFGGLTVLFIWPALVVWRVAMLVRYLYRRKKGSVSLPPSP